MNNQRQLTPAENLYVSTLAQRVLHIHNQVELLKGLPLESTHEPTGLPVFALLCLLMDSAGYTEQELEQALEVRP